MKSTDSILNILILVSIFGEHISTKSYEKTTTTMTAHSDFVTGQVTMDKHLETNGHYNFSNQATPASRGGKVPTTVDIIKIAINSTPRGCMRASEIKAYILKHFPWYPSTKPKWEKTVSGTLGGMKGHAFERIFVERSNRTEACWTVISDEELLRREEKIKKISEVHNSGLPTTVDLIKMAINSTTKGCMLVREIKEFVLKHYPQYPPTKPRWGDSIARTLSGMRGRGFERKVLKGFNSREGCWSVMSADEVLRRKQEKEMGKAPPTPTEDRLPTAAELIKEAINSSARGCMRFDEITDFIQKHFPWYLEKKQNWERHISGTLCSSKGYHFKRIIIEKASKRKERCWRVISDNELKRDKKKRSLGEVPEFIEVIKVDDEEGIKEYPVHTILSSFSFPDIVRSKQFIDKTLFLNWFLTRETSTYVTAPSKFGKSTLLNMLKYFLHAEFDSNGAQKHSTETKAYEMFSAPQRYDGSRRPLLLYENNLTFFHDHFQRYLVLEMEFQHFGPVYNLECFDHGLSSIVKSMIIHFSRSTKVPDNDPCRPLRLMINELRTQENTHRDFNSTCDLVKFFIINVKKCFKQDVILTIDEYDTLLHCILLYNLDVEIVDKIIVRMQSFMTIASKTADVTKTFCVGVLNLGGLVSIFADHIDHLAFSVSGEISKYVGLLQVEVEDLLNRFGLARYKNSVIGYYDGYRIVGTDSQHVYNIGSILDCISRGHISEAFFKFSRWHMIFDDLFSNPIFGDKVLKATVDRTEAVQISYVTGKAKYSDILAIKKSLYTLKVKRRDVGFSYTQIEYVLQYFLETGYFTVTQGLDKLAEILGDKRKNETIEENYANVVLVDIAGTNAETRSVMIRNVYRSEFSKNYFGTTKEDIKEFGIAVNSLDGNDESTFVRLLKSVKGIFHDRISRKDHLQIPIFDAAIRLQRSNEFIAADHETIIKGTGLGYNGSISYDLALINKKEIGIIIELEYINDALYALEQNIRYKHYLGLKERIFKRKTYSSLILIGLQCVSNGQCSLCYDTSGGFLKNAKCIVYPQNESLLRKLNEEIFKRSK